MILTLTLPSTSASTRMKTSLGINEAHTEDLIKSLCHFLWNCQTAVLILYSFTPSGGVVILAGVYLSNKTGQHDSHAEIAPYIEFLDWKLKTRDTRQSRSSCAYIRNTGVPEGYYKLVLCVSALGRSWSHGEKWNRIIWVLLFFCTSIRTSDYKSGHPGSDQRYVQPVTCSPPVMGNWCLQTDCREERVVKLSLLYSSSWWWFRDNVLVTSSPDPKNPLQCMNVIEMLLNNCLRLRNHQLLNITQV